MSGEYDAVPPTPPSQHSLPHLYNIPHPNSTNIVVFDLPTDWNPIVPTGNPERSTNDAVENFIFS